jgi:hypothetical protein
MPFVLLPSRNKTLQLAWKLLRAQERKEKRAKSDAEPVPAAKKPVVKKGRSK